MNTFIVEIGFSKGGVLANNPKNFFITPSFSTN
jgi:hypothetical protein